MPDTGSIVLPAGTPDATIRGYRRRGDGFEAHLDGDPDEEEGRHGVRVLGVEPEHPTGAYGVYEKLGLGPLRADVALDKTA